MENVSACNSCEVLVIYLCECCIQNAKYELKMWRKAHVCTIFCFFIVTILLCVCESLKMNIFLWDITHRCSKIEDGCVSSRKVVKLFMLKWLTKELIRHYTRLYYLYSPVYVTTFLDSLNKKVENYHVLNDAFPFLSINYYIFFFSPLHNPRVLRDYISMFANTL